MTQTSFFVRLLLGLQFGLLLGLLPGLVTAPPFGGASLAHAAGLPPELSPEGPSPSLSDTGDPPLETMAGAMIMMGFRGLELPPDDPFLADVRAGRVGHAILFDRDLAAGGGRNIRSAEQVRALTRTLREEAPGPFLIAVDQEGGRVGRLGPEMGVTTLPSARTLGRGLPRNTGVLAERLGRELAALGISVNLAPVVDVDVNPDNPAIGGLERSFGPDPDLVSEHGLAFARGMIAAGVAPALKHFPGHGGADGDSHLGLPDITARWNSQTELKPYVDAFRSGWPGMVMVGHLLHKGLDPGYPASLSAPIVTGLLRGTLGWDGVVITDDLQMRAVTDRFSLEQTIALAVNAGCDILLFGNNLDWNPDLPRAAHAALLRLVRRGAVAPERVRQSWQRINNLHDEQTRRFR